MIQGRCGQGVTPTRDGGARAAGQRRARVTDVAGFELITRRLCLVKDTGHAGVLWGGNMMAWVDEAGALYAARWTRNAHMVTKAFTGIDFKHQVRPGDSVEFWGKVARWGRTSLTVEIKVLAWRPESRERREVLDVKGVFVAIDPQGGKQPIVPVGEAPPGGDNRGPVT